jgi:copper oxidase (laccase) domain-containing protein
MARRFSEAVPGTLSRSAKGTPSLDLVAGAVGQLRGAGIGYVDVVGECTVEHPQRWFSYRRDGRTGRFAGYVVLQ